MNTREFPVLAAGDRELIDRLSVGLGSDEARVLAYLLLCEEKTTDEPATKLAVRIGTSLSRESVTIALNGLEERELIAATSVQNRDRGRPPKAWYPSVDREGTIQEVYEQHARSLIEQAGTVGATLGMESCGGMDTSQRSESTHSDQLCLGLNWSLNALHAPFFVALSDGWYSRNDITVSIEQHNGSEYALDSVASETVDIALVGAATVLRARADCIPVVPLALLFQRAMTVLYTTRETFGKRFDNTEQLRGRRIGMPDRSETGLLGRLFLSQAGVLDNVTVVDVVGEEQAALRSGTVDVVTGSFSDPDRMRSEGFTVDSLLISDQFPIYGLGIVVTERTLRERQDLLERFLTGTIAGWAEAIQQPTAALNALGMNGEDTIERERRTFERAVSEFGMSSAVDTNGWGWQQADGWRHLRTALDQVGLLHEAT
jgi:ABC-type nitrate/sulfonate/bicarbonate transport system substrate-binding protein/predicted transcriptional regulator